MNKIIAVLLLSLSGLVQADTYYVVYEWSINGQKNYAWLTGLCECDLEVKEDQLKLGFSIIERKGYDSIRLHYLEIIDEERKIFVDYYKNLDRSNNMLLIKKPLRI